MSIHRIDPLTHVHGEEPPRNGTDWREAYALFIVFLFTVILLSVVGFTVGKVLIKIPHQVTVMWRKP